MKVLHTLDSLNRGGAETLVLDICRSAKQMTGVDLTFVATGGGELEEQFENSGVDYVRLQRSAALDLDLVWKLRKIIKEREIEIVHGYQAVECLHLYLATIGIKGVKRVLSHHGFIQGGKNRLVAKYLSSQIDANISVSKGLFPWLRTELGINTSKNFYLVYNGVNQDRLNGEGMRIRREFGFRKKTKVMGMVANFLQTETKDQLTICRALPKVFEEFDDAAFVFAGKVSDGGEEYFDECVDSCVESGIGEKVFFAGARDDVPDILDALDLFVFSSRNEGMPIAVVEAMFSKVPLVISDIAPLLEVADNGSCAEVFKTGDEQELAEKIIKLLKNKRLRTKNVNAAYKFAADHFSIDSHMRGLAALYSNLTAGETKSNRTNDSRFDDSISILAND